MTGLVVEKKTSNGSFTLPVYQYEPLHLFSLEEVKFLPI